MIREVDAVYSDGVFVPKGDFPLPDRTQVRLIVQTPEPEPAGPRQTREALDEMIARMKQSVVSPAAFPITRDELHERG